MKNHIWTDEEREGKGTLALTIKYGQLIKIGEAELYIKQKGPNAEVIIMADRSIIITRPQKKT